MNKPEYMDMLRALRTRVDNVIELVTEDGDEAAVRKALAAICERANNLMYEYPEPPAHQHLREAYEQAARDDLKDD